METLPDTRSGAPGFWWLESPAPSVGVSAVHVFVRGGDLVLLDLVSGDERVVAGHGARASERLTH